MIDRRLLDEIGARMSEAMRGSPIEDLERNLRAVLLSVFDRFELVTREDFDVQRKLLQRAQTRLTELESRVAELEASRSAPGEDPPAA